MYNTRLIQWGGLWILLLFLTACGARQELVVLLPGPDGQVGAVTIGEGSGGTLLDTPLAAATINTQGRVTPTALSQAEVQQTFAHALAAQPPASSHFTLYFLEKSAELTPESKPSVEALLAEVASRQAIEVQITGHTDRVGTLVDNDRLSIERAEAVRDVLLTRGLKASFIRAVGRGEREPLIPTPDEQPEPRNRRVEVLVR